MEKEKGSRKVDERKKSVCQSRELFHLIIQREMYVGQCEEALGLEDKMAAREGLTFRRGEVIF